MLSQLQQQGVGQPAYNITNGGSLRGEGGGALAPPSLHRAQSANASSFAAFQAMDAQEQAEQALRHSVPPPGAALAPSQQEPRTSRLQQLLDAQVHGGSAHNTPGTAAAPTQALRSSQDALSLNPFIRTLRPINTRPASQVGAARSSQTVGTTRPGSRRATPTHAQAGVGAGAVATLSAAEPQGHSGAHRARHGAQQQAQHDPREMSVGRMDHAAAGQALGTELSEHLSTQRELPVRLVEDSATLLPDATQLPNPFRTLSQGVGAPAAFSAGAWAPPSFIHGVPAAALGVHGQQPLSQLQLHPALPQQGAPRVPEPYLRPRRCVALCECVCWGLENRYRYYIEVWYSEAMLLLQFGPSLLISLTHLNPRDRSSSDTMDDQDDGLLLSEGSLMASQRRRGYSVYGAEESDTATPARDQQRRAARRATRYSDEDGSTGTAPIPSPEVGFMSYRHTHKLP